MNAPDCWNTEGSVQPLPFITSCNFHEGSTTVLGSKAKADALTSC